mmetsp:Transcript_84394/g.235452  ORF Transcript_84394/g.235452 Transcript_84394/m.235452 type:complete len:223 (-) Transcript_84394:1636-2304(-)
MAQPQHVLLRTIRPAPWQLWRSDVALAREAFLERLAVDGALASDRFPEQITRRIALPLHGCGVKMQEHPFPQGGRRGDPCEVLPAEKELIGTACHPIEMRLLHRDLLPSAAGELKVSNDRRHKRQERCDPHPCTHGHQHLLRQSALRGCRVGPIQADLREIGTTAAGIEAALCKMLRPVANTRNDELHVLVVCARGNGEGVPLQARIFRQANKGVHARFEMP